MSCNISSADLHSRVFLKRAPAQHESHVYNEHFLIAFLSTLLLISKFKFMPTLFSITFLLFLLLLLSPNKLITTPKPSSPTATAAMRLLASVNEQTEYVKMRTRSQQNHQSLHGSEVEGCLPKGFRRPPSAPSRYGNFYTVGSAMCNSKGHHKP